MSKESNGNCCAGYTANRPQAPNKELIQYKLMAGDNTNLSDNENDWFFHTPYPESDLDSFLDPHFDSLGGLEEIAADQTPEGLDCVLEMSSGPFNLKVGEEVPFSFCIIFGENQDDLIKNALFAQVMYNSNYQGFSEPKLPEVWAEPGKGSVKLTWDSTSKHSKDVVTGYSDFEGYKIYRSTDGGQTWGGPEDKIYDQAGDPVGWQPLSIGCFNNPDDSEQTINCNQFDNIIGCKYISTDIVRDENEDGHADCYWKYAQFDLSAEEDSLFCVKGLNNSKIGNNADYLSWEDCIDGESEAGNCCVDNLIRGIKINGGDPNAPWYSLGSDTGFDEIYNASLGVL